MSNKERLEKLRIHMKESDKPVPAEIYRWCDCLENSDGSVPEEDRKAIREYFCTDVTKLTRENLKKHVGDARKI